MFTLQSTVLRKFGGLMPSFCCLQSQSKKRLHAVTVTAAACFLFPFAILQLALVNISCEMFCSRCYSGVEV